MCTRIQPDNSDVARRINHKPKSVGAQRIINLFLGFTFYGDPITVGSDEHSNHSISSLMAYLNNPKVFDLERGSFLIAIVEKVEAL